MKQMFLLAITLAIILGKQGFAQNTFPSSGNAGVGTIAPIANFQINPNQSNALQIGPYNSLSGATGEIRFLELSVNGTNYVGFKSADAMSASKIYVLPAVEGTNGQVLTTNGTGVLSWSTVKGANKSLSNLSATTAINRILQPEADNTLDLGSPVFSWKDLYADGISYLNTVKLDNFIGIPQPGMLRWDGTNFQGFDGNSWNSFSSGGAGANASLSNLSSTAINQSLIPIASNSFSLGNSSSGWAELWIDQTLYLDGDRFIHNTGTDNIFIGDLSGNSLTTGNDNTCLGDNAGEDITTGYRNVFIGEEAGDDNTIGFHNVFIGSDAGWSNTDGEDNTFVGCNAGRDNTTSSFNSFFGTDCGINNIGVRNSFFGQSAGYENIDGDDNSFFGQGSGHDNIDGADNSFFGNGSGDENTSGDDNAFFGENAGDDNTTGNENSFFGEDAGESNTAGSENTFIGNDADGNSGSLSNATALGSDATCTASNQVRIGNSSVTSIGGFANWSNVSDERVKKNVKENVVGLDFILKLRPVTYNLNLASANLIMNAGQEVIESKENKAIQQKEEILYSGFVAQEVEKAAESVSFDFSGIDAPKNENDLYGLRYAEFVVPLVKAVQELSARVEYLESELVRSSELQNDGFTKANFAHPGSISILGQNVPNPFDNSTLIPFQIPTDCHDASMMIVDVASQLVVSVIPVTCNQSHLQLDAGNLNSGSYTYSLYVNGKLVDTKQMIIVK